MFLYAPETRIYGQWRWMKWESMVTHDSISSGTHMHTSVLYFTQQQLSWSMDSHASQKLTCYLTHTHYTYSLFHSPLFFFFLPLSHLTLGAKPMVILIRARSQPSGQQRSESKLYYQSHFNAGWKMKTKQPVLNMHDPKTWWNAKWEVINTKMCLGKCNKLF